MNMFGNFECLWRTGRFRQIIGGHGFMAGTECGVVMAGTKSEALWSKLWRFAGVEAG